MPKIIKGHKRPYNVAKDRDKCDYNCDKCLDLRCILRSAHKGKCNFEVKCLVCGKTQILTIRGSLRGVRCLLCGGRVRANLDMKNYRELPYDIIDNTSIPITTPLFYKRNKKR